MRNETGKGKTILSLTRLSVKNYLSDNLPADTPISRQGHTTSSSGTHDLLVGDKRQPLVSQSVAKAFDKEGRKTQERRFV
ncbi:hypothetical protein H6B13_03355 [Bacteroides gallinaceum]|uniref:hypothetical protein n=1 Tax=Bacteroides gallinaceum TaxID=1462571 RepID=UPI0019585C7A|nr:hypothetical protein [Bacteroides gallinaceum]MBM6718682.1 hypothetical protein [Bacteroides gallinaceum]